MTAADAGRGARGGDYPGTGGIHRLGLGLMVLRCVDLRPRGGGDDGVRSNRADPALDSAGVADVALGLGQTHHLVLRTNARVDEVTAKLPACAEDEVLQRHATRPPVVRARPATGR